MNHDSMLIISQLLSFIFLFPVFRQFKNKFFYYFLCIAGSGIFSHSIYLLKKFGFVDFNQNIAVILFSTLSLFSVTYHFLNKTTRLIAIIGCFVVSFLLDYYFTYNVLFYYIIIIHSATAVTIFTYMVNYTSRHHMINFFHVFLVLFEVIVALKFLALTISLESGMFYFVAGNLFEIFIGLYFIIVREDRPKLAYHFTR